MLKVEIIINESTADLQYAVNKWLRQHTDVHVTRIDFTHAPVTTPFVRHFYTAYIQYVLNVDGV